MGRVKGRGRAWAAWHKRRRDDWRCHYAGCRRRAVGLAAGSAPEGEYDVEIRYWGAQMFCEEHRGGDAEADREAQY